MLCYRHINHTTRTNAHMPYETQALELQNKRGRPQGSYTPKYPMADMAIGTMFFVPGKTLAFYSQVSRTGTRLHRAFACRSLVLIHDSETRLWRYPTDDEVGQGGVGVWRTA